MVCYWISILAQENCVRHQKKSIISHSMTPRWKWIRKLHKKKTSTETSLNSQIKWMWCVCTLFIRDGAKRKWKNFNLSQFHLCVSCVSSFFFLVIFPFSSGLLFSTSRFFFCFIEFNEEFDVCMITSCLRELYAEVVLPELSPPTTAYAMPVSHGSTHRDNATCRTPSPALRVARD